MGADGHGRAGTITDGIVETGMRDIKGRIKQNSTDPIPSASIVKRKVHIIIVVKE